jgi:hypothetical protein
MDDEMPNELDINKMFEIHYKLTQIFETDIDILNIELPNECDNGFIEYKRNLLSYENKQSKLKTQIYWRIAEGLTYNSSNICYYILGIEDNGTILKEITNEEIEKSINIIEKCIKKSNIKAIKKFVKYKENRLLVYKFWKKEKLQTTDIRIILLGATETNKTKFFIGLHNYKFDIIGKDTTSQKKSINKLFKTDIFDIHSTETKTDKTLILHHQYLKVNDETNQFDLTDEDDGYDIHIIDSPGNSIISNIKYVISYNADIIIHFNHTSNLYKNILEMINEKYNNVINITDTSYIIDNNPKKLLFDALQKYKINEKTRTVKKYNKILHNIENIILINESRLMKTYQETIYNKYIFYCYNLMNVNIFDKISEIYIRNIQHKYNYKSSVITNNSISIETDKITHKPILGNTKILESLDIPELNIKENEYITTYYMIILNQIYLINTKKLPIKIIFDKLILIPEKYETIPIFIIWNENNEFLIKIFDI